MAAARHRRRSGDRRATATRERWPRRTSRRVTTCSIEQQLALAAGGDRRARSSRSPASTRRRSTCRRCCNACSTSSCSSSRTTCRSSRRSATRESSGSRELMASVDASPSEKFRRLIEAYQIEMEYGRTMSSYRQTLADGREAEMVRLGRVSPDVSRRSRAARRAIGTTSSKQFVADPDVARADRGGAEHRQGRARARPHHGARARAARRPVVSAAFTRIVGDGSSRCWRARRCCSGASVVAQQPAAASPAAAPPPAAPPPPQPHDSAHATSARRAAAARPGAAARAGARAAFSRRAATRGAPGARSHATPQRGRSAQQRARSAMERRTSRRIAETQPLLAERQGNLGELFGVTRQVAGDAATVLQQSVLSAQYGVPTEGEERAEFLRRLGRRDGAAVDRRARALVVRDASRDDGRRQGRQVPHGRRAARRRGHAGGREQSPMERDVVRVGPFTAQQQRPVPRLSAEPEVADRVERRAARRVAGRSAGTCSPRRRSRLSTRGRRSRRAARCWASTSSGRAGPPHRRRRGRRLRDHRRRRSRRAAGRVPGRSTC